MRFKIILAIVFLCSFSLGLFLFKKPSLTIELQKRFYAKINWRVEPISMSKEMRNTKIMGIMLVVSAVTIFVYGCLRGI